MAELGSETASAGLQSRAPHFHLLKEVRLGWGRAETLASNSLRRNYFL